MTGKNKKTLPLAVPNSAVPEATFDRRAFLQALGISGVAGLAACEGLPTRKLIPYLDPPEELTPGVPLHYSSTCTGCQAACGLVVTVRDGRPTKLEGHPGHPLSRGGLCALGQAEIRGLYDAGRLQAPKLANATASWKQLDAQVRTALAAGGGSVEILANSITSPTARRAAAQFASRFGGTLTEYDVAPGNSGAVLDAYEALDGRRVQPSLHFENVDLLVSLGNDFLGSGENPVLHTTRYSARREQSKKRGALKHIQVEGSLSLSGAASDERWQARASERRNLTLWLLKSVAGRKGASAVSSALASANLPAEAPLGERAARLADYLINAAGRSLVISGSSDVGEQAAVAMLNRILGNEGKTLDLHRAAQVCHSNSKALDGLRKRLAGGGVSALFVVGIDPVDQLADGEDWAKWLGAMPLSVAITDRPTATAAACKAVAASHHGLESWGDFEAEAGVRSVAQPTVRAFYDTRHAYENFLVWSEAPVTDYQAYLKSAWQQEVFAGRGDFKKLWFGAVAQGGISVPLPGPTPAALGDGSTLAGLFTKTSGDGELEVELIAQVGVRDGSRSFNPWLRELADPISRVSWTPTIAVAPSRAKKLGVGNGDVVTVSVGEQSVQMPVLVSPGQHANVLGVPVGYGRKDGDNSKAARNAYRLGSGEAKVATGGGHEDLPLMQEHSTPQGEFDAKPRPIIHQVGSYDEHVPVAHHGEVHSLWDEHPTDSPHWHMSINLDACTGCSACVIACQAENNIPVVGPVEVGRNRDLQWLRIDRYFVGEDKDNPEVLFEPMLCAHCDNAPCETVCPVAATVHSHDGLNQQAYNRCVGTRYCANNCPYKVRRFNWLKYERGEPIERMVLNPDVVVRERGVMEKCSFCVQRIQVSRIESRKNGESSFQVKTACQQSCPANAIEFGDGANAKSAVSKARKSPRKFQVLAEVGVKPSITYLARVRTRES